MRVAGQPMWAAIEDAGRLRDALGVPLPVGVPEAFTEPVADPLGDLMARYARTHGPFTADAVAGRYGLGVAVVTLALRRLRPPAAWSRVSSCPPVRRRRGQLTAARGPNGATPRCCGCCGGGAWPGCARRPSRCRPRCWPGSCPPGTGSGGGGRRRADAGAVLEVMERLAGAPVPASALETLVLPGRIPGYSPALLDELTSAGEIVWSGAGALPGGDGWLVLAPADGAQLMLPEPGEVSMTPLHAAVLEVLSGGGALFFRMLSDRVAGLLGGPGALRREVAEAVWDLSWAGLLTNDTLGPLRVTFGADSSAGRRRPPGRRRARAGPVCRVWRAVQVRPAADADPDRAADGQRPVVAAPRPRGRGPHGPGARARADPAGAARRADQGRGRRRTYPGGFAAVYPVLRAMEETGQRRRGYFVEGLGAAQFALPGAVDRMRALADEAKENWGDGSPPRRGGSSAPSPRASALVLAAADPAQPYGAALPWPDRPGDTPSSHRPGRKAGALAVLVDGALALYVERGGRTLLSWTDHPELLARRGGAGRVRPGRSARAARVERADGERQAAARR